MNPLFIQNSNQDKNLGVETRIFRAGDIYLIRIFGQKCPVVMLTIINELTILD